MRKLDVKDVGRRLLMGDNGYGPFEVLVLEASPSGDFFKVKNLSERTTFWFAVKDRDVWEELPPIEEPPKPNPMAMMAEMLGGMKKD